MFYRESLAILFVMLTASTVIGWRIADLLPWRVRPESKLFLSPLLGLAVMLHLIVLLGWIGHGYRQPACVLVMAVPMLASLWGNRDLAALMKNILFVVLVSAVATAGVLYSVWRYGAMNPYNDTFTSLVHGQWLQTHGFAERAIHSENYPAISQVLSFQVLGFRMGASFMLAYVQALMGADWSYQVYPAIIAIPVATCVLAVAAMAFSVCRKIVLSLLCGMAIGLTLNGVTYGAGNGFMAQTWGLAFGVGTLVLAGQTMRRSIVYPSTKIALGHWIPVALLLTDAIHCYPEIAPFLFVALGVFLMIAAILFRRHFRRLFLVAGWLGLLCALLVNLEWLRIMRAFRIEASCAAGGPLDWPWWHFLWLTMGLSTGLWEPNLLLLGKFATPFACIAGIGLVVVGLWWSSRRQERIWILVPHLAFLLLVIAAFIYFRYTVASPWPTGTGQSFSQFKLSKWASPCLFSLLAVGLAAIGRKTAARSFAVSVVLVGIFAMGMVRNVQLARQRTSQLRLDTGMSYDPLSAFSKIQQFSKYVPETVPICLDLSDGSIKARQILMYVLQDRPLAGDWSTDGYLGDLALQDQRKQMAEPCRWVISMNAPAPPDARWAGNLWLSPSPGTLLVLKSSTGGYPREMDDSGWWQWTAGRLHFTYRIQGEQPRRVVVSCAYMSVSDKRPVRLSVGGKTLELLLDAGLHDWTSEPIEIEADHASDTLEVAFDCDLPPVRLSAQDSREASYLIKNLTLHRVD